jgi:multidrug efflux system membrane fusion protein
MIAGTHPAAIKPASPRLQPCFARRQRPYAGITPENRSMRRGALPAALPLLALLAAAPQAFAQAPPPVTVATVQKHDVPVYAGGIGTVQAYRSVLVRARVDGTLEKIAFREGQDVKPGDLLAEIDPRPYAALLQEAQAKRAADAAQLQNNKLDLNRYASLARTNFASRQQLDTQQSTVNQTAANLQGDDAAIAAAALNLSFCRIESPIDGVVGLRLVDIGNIVHATDTTGIVTITQVQPISLVFTLPEEQLPAVRDAMAHGTAPVLAYTNDGGRKLAEGTLLTPNNSIDTTTGTIALKATFPNTDRHLWPGQFVAARIQLAIDHNAVTVPQTAIQHGPDGLYVYIVKPDQTADRVDVTLGYQGDGEAVVTKGLSGGEDVIIGGQVRVLPGQKVAPHKDAKS